MKNSAALLLVVLPACATDGPPLGPTADQAAPSSATVAPQPAPVAALPASLTVDGPTGCIEAKTAPRVLEWRVTPVASTARIARAYAHDDEASCKPTLAALRTENDHLRWTVADGALRVQFDRDTYACGRTQVDLDVDGRLVIGVVVRYPAHCPPSPPVCDTSTDPACGGPPPPPPPPPPPCKKKHKHRPCG